MPGKKIDYLGSLCGSTYYRVCAYCGEIFATSPGYAYKYKAGKTYYFCSWSCMCMARKSGTGTGGKDPKPKGRWNNPIE